MYVRRFTSDEELSITILSGLSGKGNRGNLVDVFKRPTTWVIYCDELSVFNYCNCDDIDSRPLYNKSDRNTHFSGVLLWLLP